MNGKETKKFKILAKGIFFIAVFSLIGLLGYGLCGAHFGYTLGMTQIGFDGFKIYISNVLNNKFSYLYLLLCCIYSVCYMLYKVIKCRNNKKVILTSTLFISLIPYSMFFCAGIYSSKFRNKSTTYHY